MTNMLGYSLILVITLTTLCQGQEETEVKGMMVNRVPDPINNPEACGRYARSHVCDPENILPDRFANDIDDMLKDIYNQTTVPCYSVGPQASKRKGYIVMLVVVPKMAKYFTARAPDNLKMRYLEARSFAYHLGRKYLWGKHSSNCKEMVILLYSKADDVIYTSTQSTARALLNDDEVKETNMAIMAKYVPLTKEDNAARALTYMVKKYSKILKKQTTAN